MLCKMPVNKRDSETTRRAINVLTDKCHHRIPRSLVPVQRILRRAHRLQQEEQKHSGCRDEEQGTPPDSVAVETAGDGHDE